MSIKSNDIKQNPFLVLQILTLAAGSFVGWKEVISDVNYFCESNNTGLRGLTDFSGNLTTNPVLTPCFWGSIAFVVAFVWSIYILFLKGKKQQLQQQSRLIWLLVASTIFAWANNAYTFYKYYSQQGGTDYFGCPADKISNPFATACFYGGVAFTLSLIFGYMALRKLQTNHKTK